MSFVGLLMAWGLLMPPAAAGAQAPVGFTHAWGARQGGLFNDEGRGIAVRTDGSVVWAGTAWDVAPDPGNDIEVPMTWVKKYLPTGAECWTVEFMIDSLGSSVAARGLALVNPFVEPPDPATGSPIGYVVGRFLGNVRFGHLWLAAANESAFVAKIREGAEPCAPGAGMVDWVTTFAPLNPGGRCVANAVATARPARLGCPIENDNEGLSTGVFGRVVVGGFFNGSARFNPEQELTSTLDDGFVAIVFTAGGAVSSFAIGGPGNQRITAVAIDERTQDIFVAGWFDDALTDFDPGLGTVNPAFGSYQDGRDLFVARYAFTENLAVTLKWVYTVGTSASPGADFYDDEATCLALGVDDRAYEPPHPYDPPAPCRDGVAPRTLAIVGGWRSDAPRTTPGSGAGNPIFLAVAEPPSGVYATDKWLYSPPGEHDERVTAVAVDGLGRPVFTGSIGCWVSGGVPCTSQNPQLVDFDPGPATLNLPSDSQNAFVVQYHPITGALGWAYAIGGNFNEAGTAIAFDPVHTSRFALTGYFGREDAMPGAYTIDLDPGPGTSYVTGQGLSDSFVSTLDPSTPQNVGFQVSLVLSNSCTMTQTQQVPFVPSLEFVDMLDGLRIALEKSGVIPYLGQPNPGNGVPRAKGVQVNAVFHTTQRLDGLRARQVMPWTVFDAQTAPLFARRLAALAPINTGDTGAFTQALADGMAEAVLSQARSGVDLGQVYSSVLVIGNKEGGAGVPEARDAAFGVSKFDRICALGGYGAPGPGPSPPPNTRDYQLLNIIAPRPPGNDPVVIDKTSTGISTAWRTILRTPDPCEAKWEYFFHLQRMLQRLAWCPSDFNRDECVDYTLGATDDHTLWLDEWNRQQSYADWNMDGRFESVDEPKLITGFTGLPPLPNRRVCNTCPQN